MLVKLSSKGQLVIPKDIRTNLHLNSETRFHVRTTDEGNILLEPVQMNVLELLYGKYADTDFITAIEAEHEQELDDESQIRS